MKAQLYREFHRVRHEIERLSMFGLAPIGLAMQWYNWNKHRQPTHFILAFERNKDAIIAFQEQRIKQLEAEAVRLEISREFMPCMGKNS